MSAEIEQLRVAIVEALKAAGEPRTILQVATEIRVDPIKVATQLGLLSATDGEPVRRIDGGPDDRDTFTYEGS